jgi:hypothetical protein
MLALTRSKGSSRELPLALASPPLRRCLIAICATLLDADFAWKSSIQGEPVVDVWARLVDGMALQHFIHDRHACSPTLKSHIEAACKRNEKLERMETLSFAASAYERLFQ